MEHEKHYAVLMTEDGFFVEYHFPNEEELNKFLQRMAFDPLNPAPVHSSTANDYLLAKDMGDSFDIVYRKKAPPDSMLPEGEIILFFNIYGNKRK